MNRLASRVIKLEIQHKADNDISRLTDDELKARLKQLLSGIDKTECPNCRSCTTQGECMELLAEISRLRDCTNSINLMVLNCGDSELDLPV